MTSIAAVVERVLHQFMGALTVPDAADLEVMTRVLPLKTSPLSVGPVTTEDGVDA